MGIKGIYNEIGAGQRIALSKFAVETYEREGRPLRIAIDISIWLFQIQAGKGGSNPALRTFYYRLLRLISLSIHPIFVFDGPDKPPFKRNKRTGPNIASIPEFLAKQLLRAFGLPFHLAPGEAEAECALLQKRGVVDAVLSEDVDTLMFGSGVTLRNWSSEIASNKTPTHVNLYDANKTKSGSSGLDSDGMILVAIMSGGDYIPEGIPGCGPKTACQAARAGFGTELCKISRSDTSAIQQWKDRLCHELKTNESKFFRAKHGALVIPEDFPRLDVLGYYTRPRVSSDDRVEKLRREIQWDEQEIDILELRRFTGDAFEWVCISGAKKFVRNLAPPLLVKELRLRATHVQSDDLQLVAEEEAQLIRSLHGKRNHITTDETPEYKVGFVPIDIVKLDLSAEDPDPETNEVNQDSDGEELPESNEGQDGEVGSPKKKRAPSTYDPTKLQKHWIFETFVKVGAPLKCQDWEESWRKHQDRKAERTEKKLADKASRASKKTGGMQRGALDPFARVTKPTNRSHSKTPDPDTLSSTQQRLDPPNPTQVLSGRRFRAPPPIPSPPQMRSAEVVNLLSSSPPQSPIVPLKRSLQRSQSDGSALNGQERPSQTSQEQGVLSPTIGADDDSQVIPRLPPSVNTRRKRLPLQRSQTIPNAKSYERDPRPSTPDGIETPMVPRGSQTPKRLESQQPSTPKSNHRKDVRTPLKDRNVITISSSPSAPPSAQKSITDWFRPSAEPPTPSPIRKRPMISQHRNEVTTQSSQPSRARPELRLPLTESTGCANLSISMQVKSRTTVETSVDTVDATGDITKQIAKTLPSKGSTAAVSSSEPPKKLIQLRQSFVGAWREVDVYDATSDTTDGKKAMRDTSMVKRANERSWRVSQVDMLDLTES